MNLTQGSAQTTGRATDLTIQGDGMFVIRKNNEQQYTRAGSFNFDNTGTLVTPVVAACRATSSTPAASPRVVWST